MKLVDSSFLMSAGHVLLTLGAARLVLAQAEVRSIESAASVITEATPENGMGWIELFEVYWPAYCLSDDLLPLAAEVPPRLLCVVLNHGSGLFGILCDEAQILDDFRADFHALPACMALDDSPVQGIAEHGNSIVYLTSAARLGKVLGADKVIEMESRQQTAARAV